MIRLENIHKSYAGASVLKGLTLNINRGDFISLSGKIGCGKSTLINIVAGLVKPDMGRMFYNNEEISYRNRKYLKNIGFLLSAQYLFEEFSTVHYWKGLCRLLNISTTDTKNKISDLVERFRIKEPDKPIGKLSSGNKMLVKFGTMLLNNPETLIIDEPFVHLDLSEIKAIETFLSDFHHAGNTVLLATHYPEPVYNIGAKLAILQDGIIRKIISTNDSPDYLSFRESMADYFNFSTAPPD